MRESQLRGIPGTGISQHLSSSFQAYLRSIRSLRRLLYPYPKDIPSPLDLGKTLRLSARAFRSALRLPSTRLVQFIGVRALIGRVAAARAPPDPARLAG